MLHRQLLLPKNENILLLGPRGTGKSTLLAQKFKGAFWIDLLVPKTEDKYLRDPDRLIEEVKALPKSTKIVVIDEIQKIPRLLESVHYLIENTSKKFVMSGSSARKLRRGAADLLAGRALVYNLFPFTSRELGAEFDLTRALQFGTLPRIWTAKSDTIRRKALESYALTYIKEEIQAEQVVRKLGPFRKFLEVAAQASGTIISFANVAKDVGADEKTVRSYFQILEDTLLGIMVEAHDSSLRKRLIKHPKFYFFDNGVTRALARSLTVPILPRTGAYGDAFEQFMITEIYRACSYAGNDFTFTFLRTHDDVEIDLVVCRPGKPILLVEIKSTEHVERRHLKHLLGFAQDWMNAEALCISQDETPQNLDGIRCLPWQSALKQYFY